jgi:hypothetical protein
MSQVLARFSLAAALAGALAFVLPAVGEAAEAAAIAGPPAAPIFYCPTPPTSTAPVKRAVHHAKRSCPGARRAAARSERWRRHRHELARRESWREGPEGVTESQAFIYRYERALHGLNPRAAEEAWRHPDGFWPGCPPSADHGCPPGQGYAFALPPAPPRLALPPPPDAGPPCPHSCPPGAWEAPASPPPPLADEGARSREEGWSYRAWRGQADMGGGGWRERRGFDQRDEDAAPCPPRIAQGCSALADPPDDGEQLAGRDRFGFLTWPGKTPPGAP